MPRGRLGPCRPSDMLFSASFGGLHDRRREADVQRQAISAETRIDIRAGYVEIRICRHRLHDLLQAQSIDQSFASPAPASHPGDFLKLKVRAGLQRVGREMKLVVYNAEDRAQPIQVCFES
jgi:hypothetical protein